MTNTEMNTTIITLGRRTYTAIIVRGVDGEPNFIGLIGPRGGESTLCRNRNNPRIWGHVTSRSHSTWYLRTDDGAFVEVSGWTRNTATIRSTRTRVVFA